MSIKIIKAGILDTIQDNGRYGWRHMGINPGGAMDLYSAQLANIIAGNNKNDPVIEIHFPGSVYQFEAPAVIVITGADFNPTIDDKSIAINKPVRINQTSILRFARPVTGARCYMAVSGGFDLQKWGGSHSTNLKAKAGGFNGRCLTKNDMIRFRNKFKHSTAQFNSELNHSGDRFALGFSSDEIQFIQGPEWEILTDKTKSLLEKESFLIRNSSDRMGYRLSGTSLIRKHQEELVSSPVTFGTIQLLPDGQLIILMADHQTTGGYPRIGCIITACLHLLAQKKPGDRIRLNNCSVADAESLLIRQQEYLSTLEKEIQERIVEK